jgi:hypothetical protein
VRGYRTRGSHGPRQTASQSSAPAEKTSDGFGAGVM